MADTDRIHSKNTREMTHMKHQLSIAILFLSFLCISCRQKAERVQFAYNPAQMDVGYLYEYHGSYNNRHFTAGTSKQFFYLTASDTLETVDFSDDDPLIRGILSYSRQIMDWRFYMMKEIVSESFLTKQVKFAKNAGSSVKVTVRKNYDTGESYRDAYMIYGSQPETLKKPEHENETWRIELDKLKEQAIFRFSNDIPASFFMVSRFFNPDVKKALLPVAHANYQTNAFCIYEKKETLSYNGQQWNCLKFRMEPAGLMSRILGKKLFFWLEADSGYYYLVRFRNENTPFHEYQLVRRTAMKLEEWEAFKQTVKDEFSPAGYIDIVYEE